MTTSKREYTYPSEVNAMKECIYQRRFGGGFFRRLFFCFGGSCHIWENERILVEGKFTIERNKCVDCGRGEILILIDW